MTTNYNNIIKYSRFNLSESVSDIYVLVKEYKERVQQQLYDEEVNTKTPFISFANNRLSIVDVAWLQENDERFFRDTANDSLLKQSYLSACGFICCMVFSDDGSHIILGHSTGLIQMRHGGTGTVMCTLRNIQFPPKPIYALEYSKTEDRVCYASCMDGHVYRIEIPQLNASVDDPPKFCIRVDPALECLHMQFYGSPGIASYATSFVSQRSPALSLGLTADGTKMIVGYGDTSIKVYDMATQEVDITYKVHKLRLQFIPKKLQRMHFGQVCALKCHPQKHNMFASGGWDKTLRIWDVRCKVGCVMTFEGVDICSNSIDINRDHCIAGSWQPAEALTVWDLVARKRLSVIRAQNRRPDVDGEYIYACTYWRSTDYNRKGKYAIIGGSGTNAVEVINLHNRYISCSYPATGTVLAIASHQERVAFGGTGTTFNIVKFYDPKHQKDKYRKEEEPEYDYSKAPSVFNDTDETSAFSAETSNYPDTAASRKSDAVTEVANTSSSRKSEVVSEL